MSGELDGKETRIIPSNPHDNDRIVDSVHKYHSLLTVSPRPLYFGHPSIYSLTGRMDGLSKVIGPRQQQGKGYYRIYIPLDY